MTPGPGVVLTLVVGVAIGALAASWLASRRARALARVASAWLGDDEAPPTPGARGARLGPGSGSWRALAGALEALGTTRRREAAAARLLTPRLASFVESIVQPTLVFSSAGRLVAANPAGRELAGIAPDAIGLTVLQTLGSTALAEAVHHVREHRSAVSLDVELGERELHASVSLVGDELLVVIDDRTQQRRIEDVRRDFVVNASHELKTPVTAIQALAEALDVTLRDDPQRARTLAKRLLGEAERLARLVGDLLDLRRLEEGGPLQRSSVDLAEVVRRTVAAAIPRAEARGITIEVDVPASAMLAGVPADIEAIVTNLVANAVTYNEDGGRVTVRLTTEDGTHVLTVADTGIGIPQQDHARVFERFYRVDAARTRATGGTGLGLAIVRHAVERHGGSIAVDSLLGEGTTFTVRLPVGPSR